MLAAISKRISSIFIDKKIITADDEATYAYSFEILLATIMNFVAMVIVALCFGRIIEAVLFSVGFIPFRMLNGGYHAKTHWGCLLMLLTFEGMLFAALIFNIYMYCFPVIALISFCLPFVNTLNNPGNILSEKKKNSLKINSRVLFGICTIILFLTAFIGNSMVFQYCVVFGMASSAFSLILSKATARRKGNKTS
jgi:accessory gene regulator B